MPADLPEDLSSACSHDHALPARGAGRVDRRARARSPAARVDVVEIESGHNVMISHPAELAALIDDLASAL